MKMRPSVLFAAGLALFVQSSEALSLGIVDSSATSPVTRVVALLESLSKKVEAEMKQEEDLYETFVCWGKSIISQKTQSNAAAGERKSALETYVADLDAGRIELTTERADLEKEIASLTSSIELAESLRAKEKTDFEAAESEMKAAITALTKAIGVMEAGTGAQPSLLKVDDRESFASRVADGQAVRQVLHLVQGSLTKADESFLRRVLTAEVPTQDWKKLNKKATFKEKYEARSGKILKTLNNLLETFEGDLKDASDKETKAAKLHADLMTAKGGQKTQATTALSAMEVEGGARSLSRSEASAEIQALEDQIKADEKFVVDTTKALEDKKSEWKDRQQGRTDEIAAISKGISILRSDDARDLFKRSLTSQGYSFLQERMVQKDAVVSLHEGSASPVAKVISSIDTMVSLLEREAGDDLQKKEGCETARATDTRKAITLARAMDDLTDTVNRLNADIEQLHSDIHEKEENIVSLEDQLAKAKSVRESENSEWKKTDADDSAAIALVAQATTVLESFYSSKTSFLSKKQSAQQPVEGMAAGEAPPPPPTTWGSPYQGAQEESKGILSILKIIKDDIEKDQTKASTAEAASLSAYTTFKSAAEGEITTLNGAISTLNGTISRKEGDVEEAEGDRLGKKGELAVVVAQIKEDAPGCNFFTVNFQTRLADRTHEIDGLKQAKQVLQGATFQN